MYINFKNVLLDWWSKKSTLTVYAERASDLTINLHCLQPKFNKLFVFQELVKNFPNMEKRYECLEEVSSHLKRELSCQKALIAKGLSDLSSDQTRKIKGLQMEHEQIRNSLNSLLNKHRVPILNDFVSYPMKYLDGGGGGGDCVFVSPQAPFV